jgi:hypothetical protein
MFNNSLLENGVVYGILWKHIAEPVKIQIIIRRMHIACWIPKAEHIFSGHVILTAFALQQW